MRRTAAQTRTHLLATGQALGPGGPAKQARRLAESIVATAAARSNKVVTGARASLTTHATHGHRPAP